MRTLPAGPVTWLLGSLGLHGGVVLLLLALSVRRPLELARTATEHVDAWAGSAVEVDAVATPDGVPTIANTPTPPAAEATAPTAEAPADTAEGAPAAHTPAPMTAASPGEKDALAVTRLAPDAPPAPQKKRHRTRPHPDTVATAEHGSSAATSSEGADKLVTQAATGAFGSAGLPPGVRSLPSAFTRAIPPATGADPIWQTLPAASNAPS